MRFPDTCHQLGVGLVTKPWPWVCTADVGRGWQKPRCTSRCCLQGFLGVPHTSCEAVFTPNCRGGEAGLCGALSLGHWVLFALGGGWRGGRGDREKRDSVLLTGGLAGQGSQPKSQKDDLSELREVSRPLPIHFLLAHPVPSCLGVPLTSPTAAWTSWNNIITGGPTRLCLAIHGPHPRHRGF